MCVQAATHPARYCSPSSRSASVSICGAAATSFSASAIAETSGSEKRGADTPWTLERVLIFVNGRTFPRVGAGTHGRGSLTPRLRRALLRQVDQVLPHIRRPIEVIDDVGAAALGLGPGLQLPVQVGMPL